MAKQQTMTAAERARRKQQSDQTVGQARAAEDAQRGKPRRLIVAVDFEDGKHADIRVKPFLLGQAELEFPGSTMLQMMFGAYLSLGEPGGDFDAWAETVDYAVSREQDLPLESSSGRGSG